MLLSQLVANNIRIYTTMSFFMIPARRPYETRRKNRPQRWKIGSL